MSAAALPIISAPFSFRLLSAVTRQIPQFPHASALSNRIVKPLFCRWYRGRYRIKVWQDIEMIVDPADTIGGNLAFIPQLFDVWERDVIRKYLPSDGVFVDVGANIGAYSLWAARQAPRGLVLAYEAEQTNFAALTENISLNGVDHVHAFNVGVSDKIEILKLRLNTRGNSGGHSFAPDMNASRPTVEVDVRCEPLATLVAQVGHIDFMKLDIEGFEQRVLSKFFNDVPSSSPLRPGFILTEAIHGPLLDLGETIISAGYRFAGRSAHNALFARADRNAG